MKPNFHYRFAETQEEVAAAQALRFRVFSQENGIPCPVDPLVGLDVSTFDTLPSTHHALVYFGTIPIGTARLAVANDRVRSRSGAPLGAELERDFVVPEFERLRDQVAEVGRLGVLKRWHGTEAVVRLYEALYSRSAALGVRYWFGGVDLQTDDEEDAAIEHGVLVANGWVSDRFHAKVVAAPKLQGSASLRRFYTDAERLEASGARLRRARVASTVLAFVRRLGARCVGEPALHPTLPRYVVPMVVDLEKLPPETIAKFDRPSFAPPPPSY